MVIMSMFYFKHVSKWILHNIINWLLNTVTTDRLQSENEYNFTT